MYRTFQMEGSEDVDLLVASLASSHCGSCLDARPMTNVEAEKRLESLPGWKLEETSITKTFGFPSYSAGLEFAYQLGKLAEHENHHPEMTIEWRKVRVSFSTHSIKGLSTNDFIMAAKAELESRKTL